MTSRPLTFAVRVGERAEAALKLNDGLGAALVFALQASVCSLAALWIAMAIQLDAPYWAASTVIITAQATRSQSLLKAVNRLLGTAVGVCAGLAIIALFPQGWWSFALAVATWLALCTFVSCLFRALQSYAAALAGYTAVIVVTEQFGHPLDAFDTALSRGSAVALGVTLYVTTALILIPAGGRPVLRRVFGDMLTKVRDAAAAARRGDQATEACAGLMTKIKDFDSAIEEAATDGLWPTGTKAAMRYAALGLADALVLICRAPKGAAGADALDAALAQAGAGLTLLDTGGKPPHLGRVRRTLHRDVEGALYAAARTFVGVTAAFAFWIETRWPSGATFVLLVGILCTLFAARPSPIAAGKTFTVGTAGTCVVALLMNFVIIPRLDGFGELAFALFPLLFIGAFGLKSGALAPYLTPVNFLLLPTIGITNQMIYDPPGIFNSVFATFIACCASIMIYELLPPLSDRAKASSLRRWMAAEARTRVPRSVKQREERRVRLYDRLSTLLSELPIDERAPEFARVTVLASRLLPETPRA